MGVAQRARGRSLLFLTRSFSPLQIVKEATTQVLLRGNKLCNFVEWREYKLVYKR